MDDRKIKERRIREGRCPTCGMPRRELGSDRDIFFQIRLMDWAIGIGACLLGVVVVVGIWASYRMVMGWGV